MQDISVIILTFNEEIHIKRCIENVRHTASEIFIVDSFSTDKTIEIAKNAGARIFQNPWPGNQAAQFNWALDNLPIKTKWVLRLDADEYLYPELISEIEEKLEKLPENISGIVIKRRHIFLERWMKRGTYPVKLLRLFKYGKAVCEQRWMDEHIELLEGESIEFDNDFADHNLNNLSWWTQKHNGYAIREAIDLLDMELGLLEKEETRNQKSEIRSQRSEDRSHRSEDRSQKTEVRNQKSDTPTSDLRPPTSDLRNPASDLRPQTSGISPQAAAKRKKKMKYMKKPLFWRSFAYFIYRYIFKLGFTEGKEGFLWHFLQGWWYRTLVDAKILEIRRACGTDKEKIKAYIKKEYGIEL